MEAFIEISFSIELLYKHSKIGVIIVCRIHDTDVSYESNEAIVEFLFHFSMGFKKLFRIL